VHLIKLMLDLTRKGDSLHQGGYIIHLKTML
jgi:hypothetical protein